MVDGKEVVYISGAITGNNDYKFQFGNKFCELSLKGYVVLSPTLINVSLNYDDYMHIDLAMIDCADSVYFMRGWEKSKGANIEYQYAVEHDKKIIFEEEK